ncbi:ester cyclase [Burkholderia plantarii]|uniref:ester cyclase n=1 Tax=Burkholderia plantarii TaxID=41899 RepID=UPI000ACBFC38
MLIDSFMGRARRATATTRAAGALLAAVATALAPAVPARAEAAALVQPKQLTADRSLPARQLAEQLHAARLYDTFWSTGDEAQARAALAPDFVDRTLPPGRAQGVAGPLAASRAFHAAVPDVHCEVEQMIVAGDRVVAHLRLSGHFTGSFGAVRGRGQPVDFIATDIYRIRGGRIAENWHLEDNLTFLTQLGVVKP